MGLLDSVIGALTSTSPSGAPPSTAGTGLQGLGGSALLSAVLAMLANGQHAQGAGVGGLGDLIGRFTRAGMGDVVGSWIGTGPNASISGDQLSSVLGPNAISDIASRLGVPTGEAAGQLSQLLPEVVDRLTPDGQVPTEGFGDDIGALLGQLTPRR